MSDSVTGWEVRYSNSRKLPYFYNADEGLSMWELPAGVTEEQARQLPGAELLGPANENVAPAQVRASHLLVKHRDSRRPSSWKEVRAVCGGELTTQPTITRSKEEAVAALREHQEALGKNPSPQEFGALAQQHSYVLSARALTCSDCSSARSGGDLGTFGPGQMQKPFEAAAFALPVGQLSDIVDTDSGVHLILRTA
ncbi:peptidylprolyl isomerase [Malassezia sp. CBS 17886]|nr:peptidylprolyl isomerase [Malassezia sp. CBS 17886]